jgi:hypothetical protein
LKANPSNTYWRPFPSQSYKLLTVSAVTNSGRSYRRLRPSLTIDDFFLLFFCSNVLIILPYIFSFHSFSFIHTIHSFSKFLQHLSKNSSTSFYKSLSYLYNIFFLLQSFDFFNRLQIFSTTFMLILLFNIMIYGKNYCLWI